ncbi:hypothetical protein [Chitinophaga silvisoli]|uniref:Uncharacterized protein n=1 Tax=Chitinophaga silvisoli TaxID=2291814 RepID=A0A3E1NTY7_9BACT|nr:hypothetical protein [Chitinophaga silvisoli]RFM31208.1 hypothetical protein DXN04_30690 [Chitinophaga silvisoli]
MNFPFFPLHDLRVSVEEYLCTSGDPKDDAYDNLQDTLTFMQDAIADFMLSAKDDAVLKRYMRTWQEQVRQIFDQIPLSWLEDLDPENPAAYDDPLARNKNVCYECFRLLKEMQLQYPSYFDKTCFPPLIYIEIEKSMYHHKVLLIGQWMEDKGEHLQQLWRVMHGAIGRLWNQDQWRYSYHEHDYIMNLVTQLMELITSHGENLRKDHVYYLLFYINFNENGFMHHLTSSITAEMESTVLPNEKRKVLKNMENTIKDILVRNDMTLDPGNPPITKMLQTWLQGQLEELQS